MKKVYLIRNMIVLMGFVWVLLGCAQKKTNPNWNSELESLIDAKGVGSDRNSALNDAFRDAIQRSAGVAINSEIVLSNGKIENDLIQEYSGAYISGYSVSSEGYTPSGLYSIDIDAKVSSLKAPARVLDLNKSKAAIEADGEQPYAQISTILKSRSQGDAYFSNMLSIYPTGAIKISMISVQPQITESRDVGLKLKAELKWSETFFKGLQESIDLISKKSCSFDRAQYPTCSYDIAFLKDGVLGVASGNAYKLTDAFQEKILTKLDPRVGISFRFYNVDGDLVTESCLPYDLTKGECNKNTYTCRQSQLMTVYGGYQKGGIELIDQIHSNSWVIPFKQTEDVRNLKKIEASLLTSCPHVTR